MNWQDLPLITTIQGHLQLTEALIAVVDAPWTCFQGHYRFEIHRQVPLPPMERAVAGVLLHAGPQSFAELGRYLGLLVTQDPDHLRFQDPAESLLLHGALAALEEAEMIETEDHLWQLTALGMEFAPLFCKPVTDQLDASLILGADVQEDAALAQLRTQLGTSWSPTYLTMPTDRVRLEQALALQHPDDFRPDQGDRIALVMPHHLDRQTLDRVVAVLHQSQAPHLRLLPCLRQGDHYDIIPSSAPNADTLEPVEDLSLGLPDVLHPGRLVDFSAALAAKGATLHEAPDPVAITELDAWLLAQDFLHFPHFLRLLSRIIPPDAQWACISIPQTLHTLIPQFRKLLTSQKGAVQYIVVAAESNDIPQKGLQDLIADCADPQRKCFLQVQGPRTSGDQLTLSIIVCSEGGVYAWQGCAVETHVPSIGTVTWPILERRTDAATLAQGENRRKEVMLHHLGLLADEVQQIGNVEVDEKAPQKVIDRLNALKARADLLANPAEAATQAAHKTFAAQLGWALSQIQARWSAQWEEARKPLCTQDLQDSRAAQAWRQQIHMHLKRIQEAASPWPDFCQRELAKAEAAFQPIREAFEALPKTWVLDTNVLLRQPGLPGQLPARDRIALPAVVLDELDNQKNKRDLGKAARQAIAALEEALGQEDSLPADARRVQVHNAPLSQMPDGFRNPSPDHKVLAVAYKLLALHPVVLLTEDKNLRAKAKALDIPTQGLSAPSSPEGPDWAAIYRRTRRQKDGRVHIDLFMAEIQKVQPAFDLKALGFLTPAAFVKSLPGFSIRNQHFIHLNPS